MIRYQYHATFINAFRDMRSRSSRTSTSAPWQGNSWRTWSTSSSEPYNFEIQQNEELNLFIYERCCGTDRLSSYAAANLLDPRFHGAQVEHFGKMEELRGRLAEQGPYSIENCFTWEFISWFSLIESFLGDFALQILSSVAINSGSSLACGPILHLAFPAPA